jgi:hypothetical protein
VITLEPRTPHQPDKLQKLSKNECLFTPSISGVNRKRHHLCLFAFNRVHAIHKGVTAFSAGRRKANRCAPDKPPKYSEILDSSKLAPAPSITNASVHIAKQRSSGALLIKERKTPPWLL